MKDPRIDAVPRLEIGGFTSKQTLFWSVGVALSVALLLIFGYVNGWKSLFSASQPKTRIHEFTIDGRTVHCIEIGTRFIDCDWGNR